MSSEPTKSQVSTLIRGHKSDGAIWSNGLTSIGMCTMFLGVVSEEHLCEFMDGVCESIRGLFQRASALSVQGM